MDIQGIYRNFHYQAELIQEDETRRWYWDIVDYKNDVVTKLISAYGKGNDRDPLNIYCNISSYELYMEEAIKTAIDNFGKIDILVNNAGILRDRMVFNMTPDEWDIVLKVHLYGHYNCTKPAAVLMRQQRGGRIINMSSSSGLGNGGQANYSAAKEGIVCFTRTVVMDIGRYGATCNAIPTVAGTALTLAPVLEGPRRSGADR